MKNKISKTDAFEIKFYEGILEKNPEFLQALIVLAELYTKVGHYEKGLMMDERLQRLRPTDPVVLYNLACSYSLLGRTDQAFATIRKAFECGFDNFHLLENDTDLANLKKLPAFEEYYRDILDKVFLDDLQKNDRID